MVPVEVVERIIHCHVLSTSAIVRCFGRENKGNKQSGLSRVMLWVLFDCGILSKPVPSVIVARDPFWV